jgi:hypothetical protein
MNEPNIWLHRKHRLLYCCVLIHCCSDVFTAQLRSNENGAEPQRTPLATPLLQLHVTAYVTRSSGVCVNGPLPSNGCLSPQFLLSANTSQYHKLKDLKNLPTRKL